MKEPLQKGSVAPHTAGMVTCKDPYPHSTPSLPLLGLRQDFAQPFLPQAPGPQFSQAPSHGQTLLSVPRCSLTLFGPSHQPSVPRFLSFKVLKTRQSLLGSGAAFRHDRAEGSGIWIPQQVWGTEVGNISGQSGRPPPSHEAKRGPGQVRDIQLSVPSPTPRVGQPGGPQPSSPPHRRPDPLREVASSHRCFCRFQEEGAPWWSLVLTYSQGSHGCVAGDGSRA